MLNVLAPSPPVPTMSTRCASAPVADNAPEYGTRDHLAQHAAAAAISPTVSFFTRRPVRIAATIAGVTSPHDLTHQINHLVVEDLAVLGRTLQGLLGGYRHGAGTPEVPSLTLEQRHSAQAGIRLILHKTE